MRCFFTNNNENIRIVTDLWIVYFNIVKNDGTYIKSVAGMGTKI